MGMIVVIEMTCNAEEIVVTEINRYGGEDTGNLDKLGRIVVSGISCNGGWIALAQINRSDWRINLAAINRSGGEGSGSRNEL